MLIRALLSINADIRTVFTTKFRLRQYDKCVYDDCRIYNPLSRWKIPTTPKLHPFRSHYGESSNNALHLQTATTCYVI